MVYYFKELNPSITLNSGMTLSVQASRTHHSEPRNNVGPYSEVELSFSGNTPRYLVPYKNDTVFSYVPVQLVEKLIADNGGIKEGTLPPFNPLSYEPEEEYFAWADPGQLGIKFTLVTKTELEEQFRKEQPVDANGKAFTFEDWVDDLLSINTANAITGYQYHQMKDLYFVK